ncbi:protein-L-isoaspartate(D-aspartate) O-methyltransferase [Geofilum rhodophaeum]|uniref:protein-L-isoaspartate(D-aspartate) O-methyltransferase n=1 Tax=Geofilum rhodophaeum TaxID=1965019 RepID=UPI000B524C2E|nr:protein-L-isoaspartate(D-aspartate) O-methyltransferase [Geofilum rhodophaeum]
MIQDDFRQQGLRARLVQELRRKGAGNERVWEAMQRVPRHLFLERSFGQFAYKDVAFPIGAGQTISQPSTVARQSALLSTREGQRILEVGTGSGYQSAVLAELGVELFSIERQSALYTSTRQLLQQLGYKSIKLFLGDGYEGLPQEAPFDGILVTAGAAALPQELLRQLKVGGLMVVPLGAKVQTMTRIRRLSETDFEQEAYGECAFVPMLGGIVRQ